ncbi:P-loop containing nucleoside triphosphate hydrolase protein [Neoconidiobolus thromboides FSU 785]|nr:P-loop containing nucleoside triphosphate hydrolase protein [Neoconidiobolus thromboides FSU 785]
MAEFIVQNLCKDKPQEEGSRLFSDISFKLNEGDILTIKGPSGSGKTTILKCLAELIPFEMGGFTLNNQTPEQLTIPIWRSKVMYVPQRPAILPGSPRDFFEKVHKFSSNKKKELGDPVEIARE